ncbi:hypothetical protein [Vibrio crassostreae]|uniref:hypothetical protein n=1 Tax=Vibrio crassostreae TaxID=246167 RepID=UPI000F46020D|nr:hypothetical protein [Vibrio crassostreae]ROO49121.1 hypothetical protein EDB56_11343 [Vibrio crassostreae]
MWVPSLTLIKSVAAIVTLGTVAYYAYDYGVVSTEAKAYQAQEVMWGKIEKKQDEAFTLAVQLVNQKPQIRIRYREIEKKVIHYVQSNPDKRCVVDDADWLRIRSDAVRAHNRTIGLQPAASVADGATSTAYYQSDAELLAEDVANLQTCAENAQQLRALQQWIAGQQQ